MQSKSASDSNLISIEWDCSLNKMFIFLNNFISKWRIIEQFLLWCTRCFTEDPPSTVLLEMFWVFDESSHTEAGSSWLCSSFFWNIFNTRAIHMQVILTSVVFLNLINLILAICYPDNLGLIFWFFWTRLLILLMIVLVFFEAGYIDFGKRSYKDCRQSLVWKFQKKIYKSSTCVPLRDSQESKSLSKKLVLDLICLIHSTETDGNRRHYEYSNKPNSRNYNWNISSKFILLIN